MKTILKSEFIGFESLTALLRVGVVGLFINNLTAGSMRLLSLILGDGSVLRIQAKVTEVEPWYEVGTLIFEHIAKIEKFEINQVPLPVSWLDIGLVEKLVLEGEKFTAESGICFCNRSGEQFIILPGAFPHSIEIDAAFYSGKFEPEYDIDKYERVPEI